MSQITPFNFEGHAVRVLDLDGEPWFVLADLCRVLDLSNPSVYATRLQSIGEVTRLYPITDSLGRIQNATIVSEAGMYEVVIRSDKPEAVAFRRWITTEVLPSIRKTGSYGVARELTADEIVAQALAITTERVKALTATVETQQARLAVVEPKANAFDRWMGSGAEYGIDIAAKALCAAGYMTGRNRLFEELAAIGWAYRDASGWHPYQAHGPEGTKRLAVRMFYYDDPDTGVARGKSTLKITAKGVADLATRHGLLLQTVADALESAA